ncbi:MAG: alcohol dehydrogenase catalytic domain-containing protein [Bacillota bacterium]|nr:alcohol dehydrogenase [Bacillota bacterium]
MMARAHWPRTMRVAVLRGPGDVAVAEADVPQPGPGELLVRVRACGICSSDLMDWYIKQKAPFVFGHEPAGEVAAVGEGVTGFKPGDRVVVHHHAPCLECEACRRGDVVHCAVWREPALIPGGMAEYAVVARQAVRHDTWRMPDHLSFEEGTLVEPLACVVKGLDRAGFAPGMRVLVVGLGFVGQIFGFLLRRLGAAHLAGSDLVPKRLALAEQHWADAIYDASKQTPPGEAFDLVVVTPASPRAMVSGAAAVRRGGKLLLFAPTPPDELVPFPVYDLFFREITLVTSYSAGPGEMRRALEHVAAGVLPASLLITHRFPLQEVAEAYRTAQDIHNALKVIVTMEAGDDA